MNAILELIDRAARSLDQSATVDGLANASAIAQARAEVEEIHEAAQAIKDSWESGDLAGAVNHILSLTLPES